MASSVFSLFNSGIQLYNAAASLGANTVNGERDIEGLSSLIYAALKPYALDSKIDVNNSVLRLALPQIVAGKIDLESFTRYYSGKKRSDAAILGCAARISLDLFPPEIPQQGQPIPAINNIYRHAIKGIKNIQKEFFSKIKVDQIGIPTNPHTFCSDFEQNKLSEITDASAGMILQQTILLLEECCKNGFKPVNQLSPLQVKVQKSYDNRFFTIVSLSLDLMEDKQKLNVPIERDFKALDNHIMGILENHEKLVLDSGKMIPFIKESVLLGSNPVGEKRLSTSDKTEEPDAWQGEQYNPAGEAYDENPNLNDSGNNDLTISKDITKEPVERY
jgi:hypothetical protein